MGCFLSDVWQVHVWLSEPIPEVCVSPGFFYFDKLVLNTRKTYTLYSKKFLETLETSLGWRSSKLVHCTLSTQQRRTWPRWATQLILMILMKQLELILAFPAKEEENRKRRLPSGDSDSVSLHPLMPRWCAQQKRCGLRGPRFSLHAVVFECWPWHAAPQRPSSEGIHVYEIKPALGPHLAVWCLALRRTFAPAVLVKLCWI